MFTTTNTLDHLLARMARGWWGRCILVTLAVAPLHALITWWLTGKPSWSGLAMIVMIYSLFICRTSDQCYNVLIGSGVATLTGWAYAMTLPGPQSYFLAVGMFVTYAACLAAWPALLCVLKRLHRPPHDAWVTLSTGVELPLRIVESPCGSDGCYYCDRPHWTLYATANPIPYDDALRFHVDGGPLRRGDVGPAQIVDAQGQRWVPTDTPSPTAA